MKGEKKLKKTSEIIRKTQVMLDKHGPEILTGLGIAGMFTTTFIAVKATPKALILLEEERRRQNQELFDYAKRNNHEAIARVDKLKPLDILRVTWKCYMPAFVTGIVSTTCLIGSSSVNIKRNAALATAYSLSESALKEYREKVVETIGEKKEKEVKDSIAKDRIKKNPVGNKEVIITSKGETLCYDSISGRYFKSDIDKIRKAENDLNRRMRDDMYISLNDFYYEMGLATTSMGDDLGWNIDSGYIDLDFSTQLAEDDTPCLVIDYLVTPKYNFGVYYS